MDVHIEALAYSGDTAWELSNSLEARVEQVMLPSCRLEMSQLKKSHYYLFNYYLRV